MNTTIEKIRAEIEGKRREIRTTNTGEMKVVGAPTQLEQGWLNALSWMEKVLGTIQEQPVMIEWTGNNLKEVIEFTGKSPRFDEWFKTWDEYESYVHSHGNILKLFNENGTHLEVPVGAWIFKTPDGQNVPSTILYQEQSIRKEALMEWAKKHQCEQGFRDEEAEYGYQVAIRNLIRDIESL